MIVADQRMPGMEGTELLVKARQIYPEAKRVLLTAYADTQAAIAAINEVSLDYYLLKPWDPPEEQLFPVVEDLLDDVGGRGGAGGRRRARDRPPLLQGHPRPARLPGPQPRPGALAGRRARQRGPRAADGRRGRPRTASRWSLLEDGDVLERPTVLELAERLGVAAAAGLRPLRPRHRRRRSGRAGRGGLRRLGGPAHGDGRARGARRSGRAVQPDRELPRLPQRAVGIGSGPPRHRPGAPPRRRDACRSPTSSRSRSRAPGGSSSWPAACSCRPTPCWSPPASPTG